MNEFLSALLQAVIIAVVPVCAGAIVKGIKAFTKHLSTRTDSELAKKYLADATDAITTAVSLVNQTYVDGLKKSGTFTKENQEEALSKAIKEAVSLMRNETIAFLKQAYGDMNNYLVSQIEAEVRKQKLAEPALLGAPVEVVMEAQGSTDTEAVAAAAAAAASAAVAQVASTLHSEARPLSTDAQGENPPAAPDTPQE